MALFAAQRLLVSLVFEYVVNGFIYRIKFTKKKNFKNVEIMLKVGMDFPLC